MHRFTSWQISVASVCLMIAVLLQMPQILHMSSPLYRGIPIQLNSDEPVYLARTQEALSGRGKQAAEAFIGDPDLVGTQTEIIARVYGVLFSWTGVRAPTLLAVLDSVEPVLVFLGMLLFFILAGFTRWQAFAGSSVFVLLQLYNLNRPIHMRASFFLMLAALIAVQLAYRRGGYWRLVAGILLGVLVGVYFWSWSFAWAFFGLLFAWELFEILYSKSTYAHSETKSIKNLLWTGFFCGAAAGPFVYQLWRISQHPLYELGVFRSGIHPGRMPESVAYSLLFLVMCTGVAFALWQSYTVMRPYRAAVVLPFAAFVYMNQQLVHGMTFNFVSHAIFSLVFSAIAVLLLAFAIRSKALLLSACAACIYLAAVGYDGRFVINQWTVKAEHFTEQHFADALITLDNLDRSTILSDPATSAFLAGATHHDIVYSIYLKNVLLTHEEIAERFCLTQIALPPEQRDIEGQEHLIYPDALSAFQVPKLRAQEVQMVLDACEHIDKNPVSALNQYHVQYIFWDEKRLPYWDLERFQLDLEKVGQGEGWSVWKVI